jgi:hypothetical protein
MHKYTIILYLKHNDHDNQISLGKTSIQSINGHHYDNYKCHPLNNYKNIS